MKVVVLGGLGMQGKAALVDLVNVDPVDDVICVDADLKGWKPARGNRRHIPDSPGSGGWHVSESALISASSGCGCRHRLATPAPDG